MFFGGVRGKRGGARAREGAMLAALYKALEVFSSYNYDTETLNDILAGGIAPIADAAEIDLVSVYRVYGEGADSGWGQMYRWLRAEGGTAPVDPRLNVVPMTPVTERWLAVLKKNECVSLCLGEMSEGEREFANQFGLKTMLCVPVFMNGELWGGVIFDDFMRERCFEGETLAFLRSAANLCASLIIRAEMALAADEAFSAYKRESEKSLTSLTTILNSLDALIMATVPQTGEIIFINEQKKEFFGVKGDGAGKICYEYLHGRKEWCDFCPYFKEERAPGEVVKWVAHHPPSGRIHQMTALEVDWPGGGKAYLEYGVDVTEGVRQLEMLGDVLDTLDSYVYVSDPQTDELLFTNRKVNIEFNLDKSAVGVPCWKVFFTGMEKRCDFCRKPELLANPDEPVVWEQYHPDLGRYFLQIDRFIDWPGGRNAHIHQRIDITETKRAQESLQHREKMLGLLNRTAALLLSRIDDEFDSVMSEAVGHIAEIGGFDRISVFRNSEKPEGLYFSQIYRWVKELGGTIAPLEILTEVAYAALIPRWEAVLASGQCVNGIMRQMPEAEALAGFGCATVFLVPVFINNAFWGSVFYENTQDEYVIPLEEVDMLRSASLMLADVVISHEAAAVVRMANDYTKLMLDAMPFGCMLFDKNRNAIDCNEFMVRFLGARDKNFVVENFTGCLAAEYQNGRRAGEVAAEMVEKAFAEGRCVFEWTHKALDGTLLPVEVTLSLLRNENTCIIAGYSRDLRNHKRMMNEIETQNRLLNAVNRMSTILLRSDSSAFENDLLFSMGVMAEAASADRVYLWKNHRRDGELYCAQIYEWTGGAEAQQGKDFAIETCYRDIPVWEEALSRKRSINSLVRAMADREKSLLSEQGVLSVLIMPIFVKDAFWGFLGFDDCHKERIFSKNEENILRSASELIADALVRNGMEENLRTAAEKLQTALTGAEAANSAKSDFLSRMSHEMRTPMNAIMGMAKIGKTAETIERKNYALYRIDEASEHLLGIINDILDISKIEAGKLELASEKFSFADALRKAASFVRFKMEEKKLRFSMGIKGSSSSPYVIGDEQRLTQVVINLFSNAVKFTPEEGIIRLDAYITENPDGTYTLRVEVADSGIGIPAEQQKRIFFAFEQADSGTTRKFGGTGLGLPISKRIIEQMGGEMWVESREGTGSRFIFVLKLARADSEDVPELLMVDESASETTSNEFAGKRILIAEDVEINREILISLLEGTGLVIDTAENGREALDMIEENPDMYDLVFMDVQMPEMDGFEATRLIRGLSAGRCKTLPIIAMTANVYREDIENCLAAGMNDHIGKPLNMETVFVKLRKYLQ